VVETYYDVTGRANAGHVDADPLKLTEALVDMDATGTYFGFWGHSHPGNDPGVTTPSTEDRTSYWRRIESGDTPRLVGAVFAPRYFRLFGTEQALSSVEVLGQGVRRMIEEEHLYEFIA